MRRALRSAERLEFRRLMAATIDRITPDYGISSTDGITNTGGIRLLGNASAGETVRIERSGTTVGTVLTDGSGAWSFDATSLNLSDGTHTFSAVGLTAGQPNSAPDNLTVTINRLPPAAPSIVAYSTGNGPIIGSNLSNSSTIYVLGACEVSPVIRVHLDGAAISGAGGPNSFGEWEIGINVPDGMHSITATTMDVAGNVSRPSSSFVVRVDTVAPLAPLFTGVTPEISPGFVANGQFRLMGTAEPRTTVAIYKLQAVIGSTAVDASGNWSFDASSLNLSPGTHVFTAIAVDSWGNRGARSANFSVTVAGSPAAAPALGSLSRVPTATGFKFTLAGTAVAGSTVAVSQEGVGQVGQTTANSGGQWTFTHGGAQVANGMFRYTAATRDAAGRLSAASNAQMFQPNVVLVNIDDVRPDELQYMPFVTSTLVSQGTVFNNAFVTTALSGPSRASLLSGLYAHNTGGLGHTGAHLRSANLNDGAILPVWLQASGYRTGSFGKYDTFPLPDGSAAVPRGWDDFSTRYGGGLYYGTVFNENGVIVRRGSAPEDYSTDVWAGQADRFITATNQGDQPLFLYYAPIGAHAPYMPAQRHAGAYGNLTFSSPPSLNIPPEGGIAITPGQLARNVDGRRAHLETLLSIDDAIERFYNNLSASGELGNTVFIVTGDNGYHWGEHAVRSDKNLNYDESIRVPMVVWDGRAPAARNTSALALNLDLAPTIAELAGAQPLHAIDGTSLRRAIYDSTIEVRDDFMIETWWVADSRTQMYGSSGVGIRTQEWKYNEFASGRRELFHLSDDPYELTNLASDPLHGAVRQQLAARLNELRPSDRTGPVVSNLSLAYGSDDAGQPVLRLDGVLDDSSTGNSRVGTSEYFIDELDGFGLGMPIQISDGNNDSPREAMGVDISPQDWPNLAPGPHTLWVRGRDIHGNFSAPVPYSFTVGAAPRLASDSDTGAPDDGITTLHDLKWSLPITAGAIVRALAYNETTHQFTNLSVVAGAVGNSVLAGTLSRGTYRVTAVVERPGSPLVLTAADYVYVVGQASNSSLTIVGTQGNDQILVSDQAFANRIAVFISGVLAGTYARVNEVVVRGFGGNDVLNAVGDFNARLLGEDGDDILIGGDGDDELDGGRGNNNLHGNAGNDHYLVRNLGLLPASRNVGGESWTDRVWEWVGNGSDSLDFVDIETPIDRTQDGGLGIGSYRHGRIRVTRRVLFGDLLATSLESLDF